MARKQQGFFQGESFSVFVIRLYMQLGATAI
ncbi:hypothetical protein FIU95_02635 [Microbulbifer sp. THAF38]|nr:hypothetical protein FIU95_02635 [Microbulbifer sp. THAF38]